MPSPLVRVRFVTVAVAGLIATACGSSSTASTPVLPSIEVASNQEFELAVGQRASLVSPSLTVRFDTVTADSRCASDVVCVWAGDAALRFTIRVNDGASRSIDLHSFSEPKLVTVGGTTIELVRVTPATHSRSPIALRDYRARLVVRGNS